MFIHVQVFRQAREMLFSEPSLSLPCEIIFPKGWTELLLNTLRLLSHTIDDKPLS